MIEKMKKLTFLVTNKEYDGFIQSVRDLGVVHIDQLQQGATSPELSEAMQREKRYESALSALEKDVAAYAKDTMSSNEPSTCPERTPGETLERVEQLLALEQTLEGERTELAAVIVQLLPWGEFQPAAVQALAQRIGYEIQFFHCPAKYFKEEWRQDYFATVVSESDDEVFFLTFSKEEPLIQAKRVSMPAQSLGEFQLRLREVEERQSKVRHELVLIDKQQSDLLRQGKREAAGDIRLSQVHLSDERVAGDQLRLLRGWVLDERKDALLQYLEEAHIFYEMEEPKFEDDVPVSLREDRYSRLFLPILKMYSLPNYHEIDPTMFFAPFFMLFFGLCLGDGGYGLLVMLLSLYVLLRGGQKLKDYARLGLWLGGATLVCGLATGTVFGIDLSRQSWAFLAPVKPYFISDGGVGPIFGYSPMMVVSVMLGLVQVLLGMGLKGAKLWKNYGFPYAVGTFSWLVALLAGVLLYGLPVCGVELPLAVQYVLSAVIAVSCVGIFLYNSPGAYKRPLLGPLMNIGGGAYSVYSMATGLLGDLLSYIRLFALGLTGGVLGGVFNSLAVDMTSGLPWFVRWLPLCLILLFGHGITLGLSLISAFVHPMRLIFVEFFKNAGFDGGGRAYNPFMRVEESNEE